MEASNELDLLNEITKVSQYISRLLIRTVRAFMLSSPKRALCNRNEYISKWYSQTRKIVFNRLCVSLDYASSPLYLELANGSKALSDIDILELYILRRIEIEIEEINHILDSIYVTVENKTGERLLESYFTRKRYISYSSRKEYPDIETTLTSIFTYLKKTLFRIEKPLELWSQSIITKPFYEPNDLRDTIESWETVSRFIPSSNIPGKVNEALEHIDTTPYALALLRMEEAFYISAHLIALTASKMRLKRSIKKIDFSYSPSPDEGWSGGDGLPNILLRINKKTIDLSELTTSIFLRKENSINYSFMPKLSNCIWNIEARKK